MGLEHLLNFILRDHKPYLEDKEMESKAYIDILNDASRQINQISDKILDIVDVKIEEFKQRVLATEFHGKQIGKWARLFSGKNNDKTLKLELESLLRSS
ncbi:MAG: hypothetical protein K2H60_03640 [Muribaculaceae bacterium]|nr:hypothetical protein [Muribaculaceae bacterium]